MASCHFHYFTFFRIFQLNTLPFLFIHHPAVIRCCPGASQTPNSRKVPTRGGQYPSLSRSHSSFFLFVGHSLRRDPFVLSLSLFFFFPALYGWDDCLGPGWFYLFSSISHEMLGTLGVEIAEVRT
ncbi:hypothetical protein VTN00DRAFT_6063 [Thermoascus crustaceus]|uniref:uncharacterized protein n=1 Tax=Thermoascus crustaceus TaxID=5088 RepID=UPI00374206B2